MSFQRVYLDINEAWSRDELAKVYDLVKGMEVYVYNENMVPVSAADMDADGFTSLLLKQHFSIFPFHLVQDPSSSLVITKSTKYSPSLKDLEGSDFGDNLAAKMKGMAPVKLFNLGSVRSPYLRTLKEHRAFEYEHGDISDLKERLASKTFAQSIENDSLVVVDNAMITLVRNRDTTMYTGEDHLMRLFAYNHLMSRLKGGLFQSTDADSTFVNEAEQAYIVTPVSSLIVLETQADYDRFNIAQSKDALGNATLKSNGAVPEPHEWALIILAVMSVAWIMYRERIKKLARI